MKKKILSLCLVVAMVATAVVGASMAYLTDEDSAVNVMTLGNVDIEQLEQQRDGEGDLVTFNNNKGLYPVTKDTMSGYDNYYTVDWEETTGDAGDMEYGMFSNGNNIVDKIVSVKNTGVSPAYVRTVFAFEMKMVDGQPVDPVGSDVMYVVNDRDIDWVKDSEADDEYITIQVGDTWYIVGVYYYDNHNGSLLAPGETTEASLLQVYLKSTVGNEWYEQCGDEYEILVLSQAIQSAGFSNAETALNEGFGSVTEEKATEWFSGIVDNANVTPAPADAVAVSNYEQLVAALVSGGNIKLTADIAISAAIPSTVTATIYGQGHVLSRAEGYTDTMFKVGAGSTLTTYDLTLDGAGATATGNLIATEGNGSIVLNEGTVLKNNNGAHAVSLATRGGGSLTLNGAQIINNSSDSGAIWGGGDIIVNEGSKINGNSSTSSAGAIRMVSDCNLTMNGGEISNNTAAGDGGAIWGYGASTYNFNGGVMANNSATGSGGAMWTGDGSELNISGTFEMSGNTADDAGAMRLSNYTAFNMSGGKVSGNTSKNNSDCDGFYGWNPGVNISGGELVDDITIQGGLTPTVGGSGITGIVHFDLTTNHYTINLASEFGTIYFTVNETDEHFVNCNFKPAEGYTYTEGDEAKLVCLNEGYSTYWDATTGTFRLQAND